MKNVLIFPCGSEIGLEINRSLSHSKHFRMFGASSIDDHGKYVYENYIPQLPFIDAPNFIDALDDAIKLHNIDFVIPAHDSALLKLSENQDKLKATVVTSDPKTCRICRSKKSTYELFRFLIPTPQIYNTVNDIQFPVFLKPDIGQGSKGTYLANNSTDYLFYLHKDPTLLALEYLPGKEYTVDCFTNKNGELIFAEGRERVRISNGISVNSKPVRNSQFKHIAQVINQTLPFRGAWFYQVKERVNHELVLLEIAPRIAGTMALVRACGINLIELSLFDWMNNDVSIIYNDLDIELDRALSNKFEIKYDYEYIYVDFDDTVVINNLVNANMMKYLYQSRNMNKKVILLSKHRSNIKETLQKYAISESLFSQIIILKDYEEKSDYITQENSIYIDDSFTERQKVFAKCHIPVFSLDALESLFIWKV